jgi:hypothetical protein
VVCSLRTIKEVGNSTVVYFIVFYHGQGSVKEVDKKFDTPNYFTNNIKLQITGHHARK